MADSHSGPSARASSADLPLLGPATRRPTPAESAPEPNMPSAGYYVLKPEDADTAIRRAIHLTES